MKTRSSVDLPNNKDTQSVKNYPSSEYKGEINIMHQLNVIHVLMIGFVIRVAPFGGNLFGSIYRLYREQGLEFREDPYLGNKKILDEYDFIVIGAGPGGCVVTNRLTEVPEWKVLLLEAGKDETVYTDIPAVVSYLQFTDYNWGYKAERMEGTCLGMNEQRCRWPRGKGIGGSSIINYMIYTRGNEKDFDGYAAVGNDGWSYKDVLPYYLKSENNLIPEYNDSSYHFQGGYLNVERVPHKTRLVDAFFKAGKELGYGVVDYTAPGSQIGVSRIQSTMKNGHRVSASKAFLKPIKNRCNFHVAEQCRVTKILIDGNKRAYGVEFVKNRRRRRVLARKEVILSAGALNSPQILMLSGVGPKEHLEDLHIPLVKDLRVGENLQEHFSVSGITFLVNITNVALVEERIQNLPAFIDWYKHGRGLLGLAGGVEGLAYVNSKYNLDPEYPDLEFIFAAGSLNSDAGNTVRKGLGISDALYESVYRSIDNKDVWTIWPMILRPKSRGKILLQDNNPWHWPLFYHDYFQDPSDLDVVVDGIKQVIAWSETAAFRAIGSRLHSTPLPGCKDRGVGSDEYWKCFVRTLTTTLHHQSGTCKMGPRDDPGAVVDPQLKVHGIANLRVVDASIFPRLLTAHLYAPTLMVGEKASDMIKADWIHTCRNVTVS